MNIIRIARVLLFAILPSAVKVALLRATGSEIGAGVRIGFCFLDVKRFVLGDGAVIKSCNVFTNMNLVVVGRGSSINRWNRFTAGHDKAGVLKIGVNTSITLRHYFDCAGGVEIGSNCIIAGHRSNFFTHSKGLHQRKNYTAGIKVSDWCYLGSNLCVVPGAKVGSGCFVAMGAVVVGDKSAIRYSLLAGNPAVPKKYWSASEPYYSSGQMKTLSKLSGN